MVLFTYFLSSGGGERQAFWSQLLSCSYCLLMCLQAVKNDQNFFHCNTDLAQKLFCSVLFLSAIDLVLLDVSTLCRPIQFLSCKSKYNRGAEVYHCYLRWSPPAPQAEKPVSKHVQSWANIGFFPWEFPSSSYFLLRKIHEHGRVFPFSLTQIPNYSSFKYMPIFCSHKIPQQLTLLSPGLWFQL